MKLYFTSKSIPELATLPKVDRKRVWQRAMRKTFKHWLTWFGIICGVLSGAGLFIVGGDIDDPILRILWGGICGGLAGFTFNQFNIPVCRPYIREYLRSQQFPSVEAMPYENTKEGEQGGDGDAE